MSCKDYDFEAINFSPVQSLVPPNSGIWIPVYKVELGYCLLIEAIEVEFFDEIAEQDCFCRLLVGNQKGTNTGLRKDPLGKTRGTFNLENVEEDRTFGGADTYLGGKQTVSSVNGNSKPDNFSVSFTSFQALVTENKDVYWRIENQSASFSHAVLVSFKAFQFRGKIPASLPLVGSYNVSKLPLKQRCKIIEQFAGTVADATTRTGTPSTILGIKEIVIMVSSDQDVTLNIVSGINTNAPLAGLPPDSYAVLAGVPRKLILRVGENWLRLDIVNASGAAANIELSANGWVL